MKTAIAVFAKTPGLSPVKTRLAADIGKEQAEEFYHLSVKAVEEVLVKAKKYCDNVYPYWALAEENGRLDSMWRKFPAIWTGEGDFGKRLYNVSSGLLKQYDHIVLIGTDSPQLDTILIAEVVERLERNPDKCIIGPCVDGGFYLFASAFPVPEEVWTNVIYSREDTLKQLVKNLAAAGIEIDYLPVLSDTDDIKDFKAIIRALTKLQNILPAQKKLYKWLSSFEEAAEK